MSEETVEKKRPGRKPSPLTGAVNNFNKAKRKVETLNAQVIKWQTKTDAAKGDLENAIQELAKYRKELDAVLGDTLQ